MRCEMWWCGTVAMKNATCCVAVTCVMSDVENDAKWCDFRCGGVMSDVVVRCKIKIWWCNAMWNMVWCEICCDVECGCGVDVEWCEMWTVAVMWNTLCLEMWWCEMWCRGILQCHVISDVEYGGPR